MINKTKRCVFEIYFHQGKEQTRALGPADARFRAAMNCPRRAVSAILDNLAFQKKWDNLLYFLPIDIKRGKQ